MTELVNVRTDWNGNSYDTITSSELVERIKNKIPSYEVICDDLTPKLYFDFDLEVPKEEYYLDTCKEFEKLLIKEIKYKLKTIFEDVEPNICIATAHTENYSNETSKYSIRYFISNIKATRETQHELCKDINQNILEHTDINDYVTKNIKTPLEEIKSRHIQLTES